MRSETTSSRPDVDVVSSEDKAASYISHTVFEAPDDKPHSDNVTDGVLNAPVSANEGTRLGCALVKRDLIPVMSVNTLPVISNNYPKPVSRVELQEETTVKTVLSDFNRTLEEQSDFLRRAVPDFTLGYNQPTKVETARPDPIPFVGVTTIPVKNTPSTKPILRPESLENALQRNDYLFPSYFGSYEKTIKARQPPYVHTPTNTANTVKYRELPDNRDLMSFNDYHMPRNLSPRRPTFSMPRLDQEGGDSAHTAPKTGRQRRDNPPPSYAAYQPQRAIATGQRTHRATFAEGNSNDNEHIINSTPGAPLTAPELGHRADYSQANNSTQSDTNRVLEVMCGQLALTRIPASVPATFDGKNPLMFPLWKINFDALTSNKAMTDTDRLNLLCRYLDGEARRSIEGYLMLPSDRAYRESYHVLIERYGDKFELANSYCDRLRSWPRISGTDAAGLRRYVDYLKQCLHSKSTLKGLNILDVESENSAITRKLPVWLSREWSRRVAAFRERNDEFPSFAHFVDFLSKEDKLAHDPFTLSLHKAEPTKGPNRGVSFAAEGNQTAGGGNSFGGCAFCKERHFVNSCTKFRIKAADFRMKFARENRLCFACLNRGHQARECRNRQICEICQRRHPTALHSDEPTRTDTPVPSSATTCVSNKFSSHPTQKSSMVVPVYVSHIDNPTKCKVVYAMLDTQSDTSFITEETAEDLGLNGKEVRLSLSTMTSTDQIVKCQRYDRIQVRGFNGQTQIALPSLFSRRAIPINYDHIPCAEMVSDWPHLHTLRHQLMPKSNCKVGLLIGYDCPRAILPADVISDPHNPNSPFGLKTELGWSIMGVIRHSEVEDLDAIGHSHRIASSQITGSQIVLPKSIKEVASPADCLKALEGDFLDREQQGEGASLDERRFLKIMEENVMVDSSLHYSMPLPFKQNKNNLFDNKQLVLNRAMSLKRILIKDTIYRKEYTEFMNDMFDRGFAEEVSDQSENESGPVWYVPHFGVFHKTKKKLRVVFDCSAKYKNISLNDTLLKGPDFINSLVGILCRFRKHSIAFGCDVEKMFYAFHVHPEDRNYLRFLWWKGGNTDLPLSTFRMTAHLFGAISSPACATFGLRHIAQEFPAYGTDVSEFINEDFYVDDGLKSISSEEAAISLVKRTVALCKRRGVRLHKFASNSIELLKSLPESECAVKSISLDLNLEEYPTERVLGILWDIKSDSFCFKIKADKNPKTKREILSVTSGIFDPLGWIAPFTLKARLVLQRLCRDGMDWDDEVDPAILNIWREWYKETNLLETLSIARCWQEEDYERLRAVEFHHFSDASEHGYGACSYLRTVNSHGVVSVHLVMAKARVAPSATMTIPRLELMAAVVARTDYRPH